LGAGVGLAVGAAEAAGAVGADSEVGPVLETVLGTAASLVLAATTGGVCRWSLAADVPWLEIKDPATGLIDFRTMRDGHEVYLCWKLGEGSRILYWHELEAGFGGRRAIDPLN